MEKVRLKLLQLDYILGAAIIIAHAFGLKSVVSMFFYATFFVTLFLWLGGCAKKLDRQDVLAFLVVYIAFVNVLANALLSGAAITFSYFKKYIMFSCTVLFFAVARKFSVGEREFRFVKVLYSVVILFWSFMYVFQTNKMYMFNGFVTKYLTFGFTNPNFTALVLCCIAIFLLICATGSQKIILKIFYLLLAVVAVYFIFCTKARNALLALVLYALLFVFTARKKRQIRMPDWFLFVWTALPIIFAGVYLLFIDYIEKLGLFSFLVEEGKELSSRVRIWKQAFEAFSDSPIFGAYYQISEGSGVSQLHNTHVDILASYGVVVLVLVCIFLYNLFREMRDGADTRLKMVALIGFMSALMMGIGEATLFSGGLAIYLHFGAFILLNKMNENEELADENDIRVGISE